MNKNLITTIIPTYNREEFVLTSINSIIAQTYRPIELIIVDDGSTDNTQKVVSEVKSSLKGDENFILKYIKQENQGPAAARNTGIAYATGEYFHFQDSDDYLLPEAYDVCLRKMQQEGADLCQFGTMLVNKNGDILNYVYPYKNSSLQIDILSRTFIGYTFSFIRSRSVIEKTGKWNTDLRISEDREYLFRNLIHAQKELKIDQCFYYHQKHDYGNLMQEKNSLYHFKQMLICEEQISEHILKYGLNNLVSHFKLSCYKKAFKAYELGYLPIGLDLGNLASETKGRADLKTYFFKLIWTIGPSAAKTYLRLRKFRKSFS